MGAEKRHSRAASLSRCSSFFSCFTGVQEIYEPISTVKEALSAEKKPPTLMQLGSKAPKRYLSFSCATKVKGACEQVLEAAKKGSPHISELFVGGQLFMQVTPAKLGPKPYRQTFAPSIGFLHMATSKAMETSLHER